MVEMSSSQQQYLTAKFEDFIATVHPGEMTVSVCRGEVWFYVLRSMMVLRKKINPFV